MDDKVVELRFGGRVDKGMFEKIRTIWRMLFLMTVLKSWLPRRVVWTVGRGYRVAKVGSGQIRSPPEV
ncbi:hypothetical protein ACMAZE_16895 [Pseudopelagicola sp. nBUS_20]|uniref:hypothetical protein n=1 Tax=Pseudopelagicola sp. nBUS_20 TaxID=3395317 RepID=UPI003EB8FA2A